VRDALRAGVRCFVRWGLLVEGPCCISGARFSFRGFWAAGLMMICVRFGSLATQNPAASCYFSIVFFISTFHGIQIGSIGNWGGTVHGNGCVSFEVVIVIKEHFYRIMYDVQHVVSIDETSNPKANFQYLP